MIAEESEDWNDISPQKLNDSCINLCFYVKDVDSIFAQALAVGATTKVKVEDHFMMPELAHSPTLMAISGRL